MRDVAGDTFDADHMASVRVDVFVGQFGSNLGGHVGRGAMAIHAFLVGHSQGRLGWHDFRIGHTMTVLAVDFVKFFME